MDKNINETQEQCTIHSVVRRAFDVEKHNGKLMIYTSNWDEFGDLVWTANIVSETELRRIVEGMQKFL